MTKIKKQIPLKIKGVCRIYNAIQNPQGKWIKAELLHEKQNIVTNSGLSLVAQLVLGIAPSSLTHVAVGSGTTTATASDIALETEIERNALFSSSASTGVVTLEAFFSSTEAAGTWGEAGIFTAASGGTMFNRVNISFTKTTQNVFMEFTISFTNT